MVGIRGAVSLILLGVLVRQVCVRADERVLLLTSADPSSASLSATLASAVGIELEREGLEVVAESGPGGELAEAELLRLTEAAGARFCLHSRYGGGDPAVDIAFDLLDLAAGGSIGRTAVGGELSLDIDTRVVAALRGLFRDAGLRERAAVAEADDAFAPAPPAAAPEETRPPPDPQIIEPVREVPLASPVPQMGPEPQVVAASLGIDFGAETAAAPVIVVGEGRGYLPFGVHAACYLGGRFPIGRAELGIGSRVGAARFFPAAGMEDLSVYLSLFGLDGRISVPVAERLLFRGRAATGLSVLSVIPSGSAALSKALGFVECGAGLAFALTPRFSVGLDAGFLCAFESRFPLMGVVPALTAVWKP
jgi:hypothetical protein